MSETTTHNEKSAARDLLLSNIGVPPDVVVYLPEHVKFSLVLSVLDSVAGSSATDVFVRAIAYELLTGGISRHLRTRPLTIHEAAILFLEMSFDHQHRIIVTTVACVGVNPNTHDNWRSFIVGMSRRMDHVKALTHVLVDVIHGMTLLPLAA